MGSFTSVSNLRATVSRRWGHEVYKFYNKSTGFNFLINNAVIQRSFERKRAFKKSNIYFSHFTYSNSGYGRFSYSFFLDLNLEKRDVYKKFPSLIFNPREFKLDNMKHSAGHLGFSLSKNRARFTDRIFRFPRDGFKKKFKKVVWKKIFRLCIFTSFDRWYERNVWIGSGVHIVCRSFLNGFFPSLSDFNKRRIRDFFEFVALSYKNRFKITYRKGKGFGYKYIEYSPRKRGGGKIDKQSSKKVDRKNDLSFNQNRFRPEVVFVRENRYSKFIKGFRNFIANNFPIKKTNNNSTGVKFINRNKNKKSVRKTPYLLINRFGFLFFTKSSYLYKVKFVIAQLARFVVSYYFRRHPVALYRFVKSDIAERIFKIPGFIAFDPIRSWRSFIYKGIRKWAFESVYDSFIRRDLFFFFHKYVFNAQRISDVAGKGEYRIRNLVNFGVFPSPLIANIFRYRLQRRERIQPILKSVMRLVSSRKKILGIVIEQSGRFTKRQRAVHNIHRAGRMAFNSYVVPIDFKRVTAVLKYSMVSVKVWVSSFPLIKSVFIKQFAYNFGYPMSLYPFSNRSAYFYYLRKLDEHFKHYRFMSFVTGPSLKNLGFKRSSFVHRSFKSSGFNFVPSYNYDYVRAYKRFTKAYKYSKYRYVRKIRKVERVARDDYVVVKLICFYC